MARPKIVVVSGSWRLSPQIAQYWSKRAAEVLDTFAERVEVHLQSDQTPDERAAQVDEALADADGMVLRGWGSQGIGYLSAERLARAPRLRYVGSTCHYTQATFIDVEAAIAQGIAISETAPVMSPFVAEYELALVLGTLRNLPQEHTTVGANGWVRWGDHPELAEVPERLHGRRVGLAGFGEIHRQLALMLAPFHTDWEAFDPYIPAQRIAALGGRKVDDLVAMAARSEVFCIAIPPTPETIGIINRDVIMALPRDAVFVLVSRMAVVEQPPLLERLTAGELRAGIDVYSPEPPPDDDPLRTLPNVIHTPHRAGGTYGAHLGVFLGQCHEARRHFAGEPLRYPLRPEMVAIFARAAAARRSGARVGERRSAGAPRFVGAQRSYTGSGCSANSAPARGRLTRSGARKTMKSMDDRISEEAKFLDLACLTYGNDATERIDRAKAMLAARPALAEADAHAAAATANVGALRRLLDDDPGRASAAGGPRDWPPLLYLCYSRVTEQLPDADAVGAARLLLEHGADPNAHFMWDGTYRFTALTGAMGEGEGGVVSQPPHAHAWALATLLLDAGADPNDAQGLYNTIFRPDNRWLKLLLDRGLTAADRVNWKTDNPIGTLDFMLGHAVVKGFTERAALLLRHGADPRGANYYDGRSHHENALLNGFGEIAEMLVRAGAEPVELSPENRFRAACMRGDEAAARAELEHVPDALADPGTLHAAASLGNVAAVRCLLSLGADPNATAADGTTALHQTAWHDRRAAAEVLAAHGARPLRDANHGSTPAGWADHAGNAAMRDYLLDSCPDGLDLVSFGRVEALRQYLAQHPDFATATLPDGGSPLHHLRGDVDHLEQVVAALLEAGADVAARDGRGETPGESAVRRGEAAVAALLSS